MDKRTRRTTFILVFFTLVLFQFGCGARSAEEKSAEPAAISATSAQKKIASESSANLETPSRDSSITIEIEATAKPTSPAVTPKQVQQETGSMRSSKDCPIDNSVISQVTLTTYSSSPNTAAGRINMVSDWASTVVGNPNIAPVFSSPKSLMKMKITDIQRDDSGFTFQASWPAFAFKKRTAPIELQLKVELTLSCGDATTKTVNYQTHLYYHTKSGLCAGSGWSTSPNTPDPCDYLCEMAPSPIIDTDQTQEGLLNHAMEVDILAVAEGSRSLCLVAEVRHAKGPVEYQWIPTDGAVDDPKQGGVVWKLSKGSAVQQIQLSVTDRASAAVASFFVVA
jgi:hypothetical protein